MNFGIFTVDPSVAHLPALVMLAVDLLLAIAILALVRTFYSAISGLSMVEEVAGKDNFAMGITVAAATAGVAIMLTGVVAGEFAGKIGTEVFLIIAYGIAGLLLIWISRLVLDRISLSDISVREQVLDGNIAVAAIEAGNVIATAVMVRAIMLWVEDSLSRALPAILLGYVASQIILVITAYYRRARFSQRNDGGGFIEAIRDGNVALGMRFAGFQVGVALAVTAASDVIPYQAGGNVVGQAIGWAGASLILSIVLIILSGVAERYVMRDIDVTDEVDGQRNVGVALMEVAVYIGVGLLLAAHLA